MVVLLSENIPRLSAQLRELRWGIHHAPYQELYKTAGLLYVNQLSPDLTRQLSCTGVVHQNSVCF